MEARRRTQIQLLEQAFHLRVPLAKVRVRNIGDVKDQARFFQLFQRGAEGDAKVRGQVTNKADRIGQQDGLPRPQRHSPDGGVQGGKHLVRGANLRACEGVKEGGFPRVRVSHQSDQLPPAGLAKLPVQAPPGPNLFNRAAQPLYAGPNSPPVHFQLLLARSPGSNAAAQPGKDRTAADQSRQQIRELGQLHL